MTTLFVVAVAVVISFGLGIKVGRRIEERRNNELLALGGEALTDLLRGVARGEVEVVKR